MRYTTFIPTIGRSFLKLSLFILVISLSLTACRKTEQIFSFKKTFHSKKYGNVTAPSVSNGMLEFDDQEHYDAWINYLNETIIKDTATTDTTSQDSILHSIELEIGFNSLRQKAYQEFEVLNEAGWSSLEEIPEIHWINNIIIRSTLNEYEEVKIGNEILSYVKDGSVFSITDIDVLSTIRIFKSSDFEFVSDVFMQEGVIQSEYLIKENVDDIGVAQEGNLCIRYEEGYDITDMVLVKTLSDPIKPISGGISYDGCVSKKTILKEFYLLDPSTSSKMAADYSVNWGDGSSQNYGSNTILNCDHIYSTTGTKNVTVTATNVNGSYTWIFTVDPKITCSAQAKNMTTWFYPAPYQWAIRGSLHIKYGRGISRDTWTSATSEPFTWNSSKSTWEKARCENLYTKIIHKAVVPSNCSPHTTFDASYSSYSAKLVEAVINNDNFGYEEVKSIHGIYGTGHWYLYEQTVEACN